MLADSASGDARRGDGQLYGKLDIKDTEFTPWLERELASRAAYECVETMADFRRLPRAITKAGQIKGTGGRHEKDDRRRVDDRSGYVLGWARTQDQRAARRASTIRTS